MKNINEDYYQSIYLEYLNITHNEFIISDNKNTASKCNISNNSLSCFIDGINIVYKKINESYDSILEKYKDYYGNFDDWYDYEKITKYNK